MTEITAAYMFKVRTKLEEKFSHVTFVKTVEGFRGHCWTVWTVGEDMEQIQIEPDWIIDELFAEIELDKLKNASKGRRDGHKVWLWFRNVVDEKIPCDYRNYKKYTEAQLTAIHEA